jgi:hypothetical protein
MVQFRVSELVMGGKSISVMLCIWLCKSVCAYLGGLVSVSLSSGYLTSKQRMIWGLKCSGIREANIARKLHVTRQTVHKAVFTANLRVGESLGEAAKLNRIDVEAFDAVRGFLVGYSSHFKTRAFVTFSAKNGIQVWYKHEGYCESCSRLQTCKETILAEARERNIPLSQERNSVIPSQMADELFSKLTGANEQYTPIGYTGPNP